MARRSGRGTEHSVLGLGLHACMMSPMDFATEKTMVVPSVAAALVAALLAGCASTGSPPGKAANSDADAGYFLSFGQKWQLISEGRIADAQGNEYDIWIVPGYVARKGRMMSC